MSKTNEQIQNRPNETGKHTKYDIQELRQGQTKLTRFIPKRHDPQKSQKRNTRERMARNNANNKGLLASYTMGKTKTEEPKCGQDKYSGSKSQNEEVSRPHSKKSKNRQELHQQITQLGKNTKIHDRKCF